MKTIPLIQFGLGGVGSAVAERVLAARDDFEWHYGLRLVYVALCDSRGAAINGDGFSHGALQRMLVAKAEGQSIVGLDNGYYHDGLRDIVDVAGTTDAIVIDVTASSNTSTALQLAIERGYAVVLANKKPLTEPYEVFRNLVDSGRVRYESTVGAGVPVIATLSEALMAAHDPVRCIEGCFSSTLGYLTAGLQGEESFSELVRTAKALGYTEPDPREDLGGMDVARKALILARTMGWPLELEQVSVQSFYPAELEEGSVDDFLDAVHPLDDDYALRVAEARTAGETLRYVAQLQGEKARVGLQSVPCNSPLGQLQGTDNLIAFHSSIYDESPLVLQGRGAGVHGTAAGVLADIVALANHA